MTDKIAAEHPGRLEALRKAATRFWVVADATCQILLADLPKEPRHVVPRRRP